MTHWSNYMFNSVHLIGLLYLMDCMCVRYGFTMSIYYPRRLWITVSSYNRVSLFSFVGVPVHNYISGGSFSCSWIVTVCPPDTVLYDRIFPFEIFQKCSHISIISPPILTYIWPPPHSGQYLTLGKRLILSIWWFIISLQVLHIISVETNIVSSLRDA